MIRIKDHKTGYIFDPWDYLGPKRRKLMEESWAGLFRQEILDELPVNEIASAFSDIYGRPTKELYMALGVLVLQQMQDLTDEETSQQVAFNLQWHYALDITEETDEAKYLCPRTLWHLRQLVTEKALDTVLFQTITDKLARVFKVDASQQRLDSVHIQSNMRHLGRIGIVVQTIHKFLVNLKRQHPDLFGTLPSELVDRYLPEKALGCFSMVKPSESERTLKQICQDLFALVQQMSDYSEVASMSSFQLLQRVLKEQCHIQEAEGQPATVTVKAAKEVSSDSLQNPSDPDAGYDAHKGKGYQAQLLETYSENKEQLSLITAVQVESATVHDVHALIPAIEAATARGLKPTQVLADTAYGSEDNLGQAQGLGVEVIAPAMGAYRSNRLPLSGFVFSDTGEVVRCPQGQEPERVRRKQDHYRVAFPLSPCAGCPVQDQCPTKPGKKYRYLRYDHKVFRLAQRRQVEQTEAFKQRYRFRAGVEGAFSAWDRRTGVKHLRVRGGKAVRFAVTVKAAAMNILRATAFKTRKTQEGRTPPDVTSLVYRPFSIFKELIGKFFKLPDALFTIRENDFHFHAKCAA
jgi:hypothetical protein